MSDINPDYFKIDPLRLDRECMRQPRLYHEIAVELANARREMDEASSELKVEESELAAAIRKDPAEFNCEKVTEGSVAATIILQKTYQTALTVVREARHKHDVLTAAVNAMEHKKRSLTLLVNLHGMDYFSDPKVTASVESRASMEEGQKREARNKTKLKPRPVSTDDDGEED